MCSNKEVTVSTPVTEWNKPMHAMSSRDQPTLPDGAAAPRQSLQALHSSTVRSFANAMAENILRSAAAARRLEKKHSEESPSKACGKETVENLASGVSDAYSRRPTLEDTTSLSSLAAEMDVQCDALSELSLLQSAPLQPHQHQQHHHHHPILLSQTAGSSLDYPDAPPTTPDLPELVKGRDSFARKLKGGLAKEFSPSPPPSTPKNEDDEEEEIGMETAADARVDFVQRLVVSLSVSEGGGGGREDCGYAGDDHNAAGGPPPRGRPRAAVLAAYAEALSAEILDWGMTHRCWPEATAVTTGGGVTEQGGDACGVQCLADRMAQTIISSTLREVTMQV